MGALGSGSWTIGGANGGSLGENTTYGRRQKTVGLKLTIASGAWPATGVPLPSAGSVGLVRNLEYYMMAPKYSTVSNFNVMYTLTTGHKVICLKSVVVSGANGKSFQTLATNLESGTKIFFVTARGW